MNIFSVDAESDGLYGDIWAIGAVVVTPTGEVIDEFSGQAEVDRVQDEWVRADIVPVCRELHTFATRLYLRERFWEFWLRHRDSCICVGDFGAPVEALLFRKCIEDILRERMWLGPYPMHELGTALLLAGVDPDVNRIEYTGKGEVKKHNPLDAAAVAAACWLKATKFQSSPTPEGRCSR